MRRAAVCFAVLSVSCGPPLMKLPSGPGIPTGDAAAAVKEAMSACRGVSTLTAELPVSGLIGARRSRGRLLAGVAAPNSARLEAVAPAGQPLFIFVPARMTRRCCCRAMAGFSSTGSPARSSKRSLRRRSIPRIFVAL